MYQKALNVLAQLFFGPLHRPGDPQEKSECLRNVSLGIELQEPLFFWKIKITQKRATWKAFAAAGCDEESEGIKACFLILTENRYHVRQQHSNISFCIFCVPFRFVPGNWSGSFRLNDLMVGRKKVRVSISLSLSRFPPSVLFRIAGFFAKSLLFLTFVKLKTPSSPRLLLFLVQIPIPVLISRAKCRSSSRTQSGWK